MWILSNLLKLSTFRKKVLFQSLNYFPRKWRVQFLEKVAKLYCKTSWRLGMEFYSAHFKNNLLHPSLFNPEFEENNSRLCRKVAGSNHDTVIRIFHWYNPQGPSRFLWSNQPVLEMINLLKPTGHVMRQQFNIQQLYVLPTLYLCVLYLSEKKQRLVLLTA